MKINVMVRFFALARKTMRGKGGFAEQLMDALAGAAPFLPPPFPWNPYPEEIRLKIAGEEGVAIINISTELKKAFSDPLQNIRANLSLLKALIALDKPQESWEVLQYLIRETERQISAGKIVNPGPLLAELFPLICHLIPEIKTADGPRLILAARPKVDDTVVNLGIFYPPAILPAITKQLDSVAEALLLAGQAIGDYSKARWNKQTLERAETDYIHKFGRLHHVDRFLEALCRFIKEQIGEYVDAEYLKRAVSESSAARLLLALYGTQAYLGYHGELIKPMNEVVFTCGHSSDVQDLKDTSDAIRESHDDGEAGFESETHPPKKARFLMVLLLQARISRKIKDYLQGDGAKRQIVDLLEQLIPEKVRTWLEAQPEVKEALKAKAAPFEPPPESERVSAPEEALLAKARQSESLLFTRNVSVEELKDILVQGKICGRTKHYRLGLGHEYAKEGAVITVVFKRGFWRAMQGHAREGRARIKNLFLQGMPRDLAPEEAEAAIQSLTARAEYNRRIPLAVDPSAGLPGHTIMGEGMAQFMGYYPQIESAEDVPLDQIEAILVPEHLMDQVPTPLSPLIYKVVSGSTEAEFLAGRQHVGRRSRAFGGRHRPNMGYNALRKFEYAYFRLVAGCHAFQYQAKVAALVEGLNYKDLRARSSWIDFLPKNKTSLTRQSRDWKIFVNPREDHILEVLDKVLRLSNDYPFGVSLKAYADPAQEWRSGRTFGSTSDTPKIVIYVNEDSLCPILEILARELPADAGFGELPGPSFARRINELLFYKREYADDPRVSLGTRAAEEARAAGITDPAEIRRRQEQAIAAAGFDGDSFYKRAEDLDPANSFTKIAF